MAANLPQKPTLVDLMAAVGFFLLRWGELERRRGAATLPVELEHIRQLRNATCHGLEAVSGDPRDVRQPFIRCRAANGDEATHAWTDLDNAIRTLERFNGSSPR